MHTGFPCGSMHGKLASRKALFAEMHMLGKITLRAVLRAPQVSGLRWMTFVPCKIWLRGGAIHSRAGYSLRDVRREVAANIRHPTIERHGSSRW